MQVNELLGELQHACCPCHVALVRLDRIWVAQLAGGLRVVCGCAVRLGLAWLSAARFCLEWPFANAHPQTMVCVLAKHQLCDVHFFFVLVVSDFLCDGHACLYTWGALVHQRISAGAGTRCGFLLLRGGNCHLALLLLHSAVLM